MKELKEYKSGFENIICKISKFLIANNIEWVTVIAGGSLLLFKCLFGLNFSYGELVFIMLSGVMISLLLILVYAFCFGIDIHAWFRDNYDEISKMDDAMRRQTLNDESTKKLQEYMVEVYEDEDFLK